jgi:hypothetical protein
MAKLIGHYFNPKEQRGYSAFEVDNLKETGKQYKKTAETVDGAPPYTYDYWNVMLKSELDKLRAPGGDSYLMYSLQQDMPLFKTLVVERLEQAAENAKQRYDSVITLLEEARGGGIEEKKDAIPESSEELSLPEGGGERPSVLGQIRSARQTPRDAVAAETLKPKKDSPER